MILDLYHGNITIWKLFLLVGWNGYNDYIYIYTYRGIYPSIEASVLCGLSLRWVLQIWHQLTLIIHCFLWGFKHILSGISIDGGLHYFCFFSPRKISRSDSHFDDWTTSFSSNSVMSEKKTHTTTISLYTRFHFTDISNCHFSIASGLSKTHQNEPRCPRWFQVLSRWIGFQC